MCQFKSLYSCIIKKLKGSSLYVSMSNPEGTARGQLEVPCFQRIKIFTEASKMSKSTAVHTCSSSNMTFELCDLLLHNYRNFGALISTRPLQHPVLKFSSL